MLKCTFFKREDLQSYGLQTYKVFIIIIIIFLFGAWQLMNCILYQEPCDDISKI